MASVCNAVLVVHKTGMTWVEDPASISALGERLEGTISVGQIDDPAVVAQIGAQYLAGRTTPIRNVFTEVGPQVSPGVDFDVADTLELEGETIRATRISYSLDGDRVRAIPEFDTPKLLQAQTSQRALDRIIQEAGGSSTVSARPLDFGTPVSPGKVGTVNISPWSWQAGTDLDKSGEWPAFIAEQPARLYEWLITCDNDEADGTSIFEFRLNGTPVSGLLNISIAAGATGGGPIPLYGYTVLRKGDRLAPVCTTNGHHTNGSIQFRAADVL